MEDCINRSLVTKYVTSVSIKHFSDHVGSCFIIERSPETLLDMAFSIETIAIDVILLG